MRAVSVDCSIDLAVVGPSVRSVSRVLLVASPRRRVSSSISRRRASVAAAASRSRAAAAISASRSPRSSRRPFRASSRSMASRARAAWHPQSSSARREHPSAARPSRRRTPQRILHHRQQASDKQCVRAGLGCGTGACSSLVKRLEHGSEIQAEEGRKIGSLRETRDASR